MCGRLAVICVSEGAVKVVGMASEAVRDAETAGMLVPRPPAAPKGAAQGGRSLPVANNAEGGDGAGAVICVGGGSELYGRRGQCFAREGTMVNCAGGNHTDLHGREPQCFV